MAPLCAAPMAARGPQLANATLHSQARPWPASLAQAETHHPRLKVHSS